MKSIRLYLLLAVIATITLVNFVSLLHGYQSSMAQAQQLFDARLQSMAMLIASANQSLNVSPIHSEQETQNVYYQIWKDNGQLISRSSNAPEVKLLELSAGFHDVNYVSYRWRSYVFKDTVLNRWIVTAERSDIRYGLAEQVIVESVYSIVLGMPVVAIIIWLVVGMGLRPLHALAEQLNKKQLEDLSPVVIDYSPIELKQVVQTTNSLFKRLEGAFQREQRFSADAAHELRTPVSGLKVHLHNLKENIGNENQDLNMLSQSVDRIEHLIEQILDLHRCPPDQAAVEFKQIDLHALAKNSMANNYQKFETKHQTIVLNGMTCFISGYNFALETLLQNLLANASKYTPDGGELVVDVSATDSGVRLTVEDSGVGIPSDYYQRVFERFYRLHGDKHDSNVIGCGLGLAIVKHIVDMHSATIFLGASQFESGLKVTIDFPKVRGV